MTMEFGAGTVLHTPRLTFLRLAEGIHIAIDAEAPNWIATDERGAKVLSLFDGTRSLAVVAQLSQLYAEPTKRLQHVMSFAKTLLRVGLVQNTPFNRPAYKGRTSQLTNTPLREMWLHTNDSCNLTCEHCLVSSSPSGSRGLPTDVLFSAIDQATALGAERFFITGGEPFLRADLGALVERVTKHHGRDLVILTNATLLDKPANIELIQSFDRGKVRFQVSLDGASAEDNDAVRGQGTFAKATAGLSRLAALGFETSLAVVPLRRNLDALPVLPALAKQLGATSVHLMWAHRRGRGLTMLNDLPTAEELFTVVRAVRDDARAVGLRLDNLASLGLRVNAIPGVKHDLGMAGVETLCLYTDGGIYPSAATAGHAPLRMGSLHEESLRDIWLFSPIAAELRSASLTTVPGVLDDPLRFINGGGDIEQAYFWSGSFVGGDPYAPLTTQLALDMMLDLARKGRERATQRVARDAPVVFHAMGDGALVCGDEVPGAVRTLHSNCVLAFDVERPRALMRAFYGEAAEAPKADLCCPVRPSEDDLKHIPRDVVDRFYGCGSPVADAALTPGEVHLDLGSGAGIDVFIAAKHVGAMGRAIGVDMTDAMLSVARENQPIVARNLGYDVVGFVKGVLEDVPLPDSHVDCVTSNCVVNLSPDKCAVFGEIWRVLKDGGRLVLSDIVAEKAVPPHLRVNPQLWGECLSGALTEEELLESLERAGFHGVEVLSRVFWREVQGHRFLSLTVRAYKHAAAARAERAGHRATYLGPWKSVTDEEGLLFRRGEPVEVSVDTAAKLSRPPYAHSFVVQPPGEDRANEVGRRSGSVGKSKCC
jgi:MoaA/NifB/PqqE/SkfB family radical SAM enzyme/SAM-dependent methyltransferase